MRIHMSLATLALMIGSAALANDCPNLSGKFGVTQVTDENGTRSVDPTQVKIVVVQSGCASLTITQNRELVPEESTVTRIRTDGTPMLYIPKPEDSDGPDEYTSFGFKGQKLAGEILYLYEGNSQFHHTGAILTYDLDETNNLREYLAYPDGLGGMKIVLSYKTERN